MRYILICLLGLLFIGCGCKQPEVVTKYEVKYVSVPVKVKVPEIDCEFTGEDLEPVYKLIKCLSLHKKVLDEIRDTGDE